MKPLLGYTGSELIRAELTLPKEIVGPIVQEGSLTLIWGQQKSGKTFVVGKLAYSIATGTKFFKWNVEPKKVLVLDSEMRDAVLQKRLKLIHYGHASEGLDNLRVITREHMGDTSWNLVSDSGKKSLLENIGDAQVIILDNYNNLTGETALLKTDLQQWKQWEKMLSWLRTKNIAVVLVHHGNKSGEQTGTQQRVNFMDTVIQVKQDRNVMGALGMEFNFTDSRSYFGSEVESLLLEMRNDGDVSEWSYRTLSDHKLAILEGLIRMKTPKNRLAETLGVPFLELQKLLHKLKEQEKDLRQTEDDFNDNPF